VGLIATGGAALIAGIALWFDERSLQDQINSHATNTLTDIQNLRSLEDRASTAATWGDVLVIAGIAAGGAGTYFLWRAHRGHVTAITPAPAEHGAGMTLVVGGHW
jgi:hypothetical protein